MPADLLAIGAPHPRPDRLGDELRAEADAEYRDSSFDRLAHQGHFGGEMRMGLDLVDVHRSAEDHQSLIAVEARLGARIAAEVDVADAEARRAQLRVERPERLPGDVLADEKLRHVRAPESGA